MTAIAIDGDDDDNEDEGGGDDGNDSDEDADYLHCISDEQNHHSVPKCQLEFLNPSHASEIKIQLILFHEIRIEI